MATHNDNSTNTSQKKCHCTNHFHAFASKIIRKFEDIFYLYGRAIGKRPFFFIIFCLVISALCGIGLLKFKEEIRPFKLWIPQDSDFIKVKKWQNENFPNDYRVEMIIYESQNVLSKDNLRKMFYIHNKILNISTDRISFQNLCAKLPKISGFFFGRKKRRIDYYSQRIPRKRRQADPLTCYYFDTLEHQCMENSIIEIWNYDINTFESLTQDQILRDINFIEKSPTFGVNKNFSKLLGGIERNNEGLIVKAKAVQQMWITKINRQSIIQGDFIDDPGTGMQVDTAGFEWEGKFIDVMLNESQNTSDLKLFFMTTGSFGRVSESTILGDVKYLALGFTVVFIYVQIMLGRFDLIGQRPILSFFGICSIVLSILVSYGLCCAIGAVFGPVNSVLPFLLLGLGVDDMFVFMQSWNNLLPKEKELELPDRVGRALKHAGVSITITSLTDFVAFAVGSTTVLPALRSFCLYAAVGILAIYFFQATFFVAWFTLDQRRLEDNRQGLFWCWKLKNYIPSDFSKKNLCEIFFSQYFSFVILKKVSKICIILFTLGYLSVSIWGVLNLKQEFNPIWFIPQNSYLYKYFDKKAEYYPSMGYEGIIYFGNFSLSQELTKVELLITNLKKSKYIGEVDSWFVEYKDHLFNQGYEIDDNLGEELFLLELQEFLFSAAGAKYKNKNFKFGGIVNCTNKLPPIIASSIDFKYKFLPDTRTKILAMDETKSIVNEANISGYAQAFCRYYIAWETDKIIEVELYRNLGMALIVIFMMVFILIASFITSSLVLLCVIMTLVDVGALMQWWGLTIDTVSCIDIVLAVGLCVDYAAHIGHTFMTVQGTRNDRVKLTLSKIGPAVLNGGFSTVLAFAFLANSDSHVFRTFFKIFFGVSLFGLYHGLVFLPVVLSLIGPSSYEDANTQPSSEMDDNDTPEIFEDLMKENGDILPQYFEDLRETVC